jgi:hypothetical protein
MQHLANKQQAEEDMKIVAPMLAGSYQSTWHDPNSEIETYRYEDEQYIADYKKLNDALRKAQSPTAFDSKGFENLSTSVMQNPRPVKEDSWGRRVNEYILEYNKWAELPQPKDKDEENIQLEEEIDIEKILSIKSQTISETNKSNKTAEDFVLKNIKNN